MPPDRHAGLGHRPSRRARGVLAIGLAGVMAAGGWLAFGGRGPEVPTSNRMPDPNQAGLRSTDGCGSGLPPLPAEFRVQPISDPRSPGMSVRLLERGRVVAEVLGVGHPTGGIDVASARRGVEAQLRESGARLVRSRLGPFAGVLSTRPGVPGSALITWGPCRSYSVRARDSRSARGIALVLLGAEVRQLARARRSGPPPNDAAPPDGGR